MIVKPEDVVSPRDRLTGPLVVVFDDGDWSMATAYWDKTPSLLMRWNGSDDRPKGNPISTGMPTWFVVPEKIRWSVLAIADEDTRLAAVQFLALPDLTFGRDADTESNRRRTDKGELR